MNETEQRKVERGVFAKTKLVLFDLGGVLLNFMGGRSPQREDKFPI
ncbi:MAG: hypothetical protein UW68_C0017G0021 [Candidatus Collierbacteria bacterium GW2011_GWB1_44_6]|uniref:Uncharacterized protein n=2 Tax=Candidatus Collieribacteriota TaxID=1752725 RepID=A0A0G1JNK7_9BACT|nr:MAG: hypothetical protein UV68_C0016G0003 [Candidatus Collierbacteria bacterium GW2011_GWC2_43_12]KKT73086.1 MAG: hypothetical protein UW68_C0017G0021 [Candidatus Collierbacteria bacterium GW2011_GWB1_44_6]KKT83221.1 MAG: hypothetical protein UW80_C0019G0031 [Microgenomates group bacterium GW2011_GWC1_44_9]